MRFQIRIGTKTCYSCLYFECEKGDERKAACIRMSEYGTKIYENNRQFYPLSQKKLPNKVLVQEMDMDNKTENGMFDVKKDGIKFNLTRCYLKKVYRGGEYDLEEWYVPVDIVKKQKTV